MKVNVIPRQTFIHDRYDAKKGVEMPMSLVQARLLRDAGLIEEFDESAAFEAEDDEPSVQVNEKKDPDPENKKLPEPDNKSAQRQPAAKTGGKAKQR